MTRQAGSISIEPPKRGFIPPRDEKERLIVSRAQELAKAAMLRGQPRDFGFLSDREQALARIGLDRAGCRCFSFEGGYPDAERRVLCIRPEGVQEPLPVACVRVSPRSAQEVLPAHRDLLGAVLSLGLERICVGDILRWPERGFAAVFVRSDKQPFICAELHGAAGIQVTAEPWQPQAGEIPAPERVIKTVSLPSLRLDAFLAAALGCSRSAAAELVRAGQVEINHVPASGAHEEIFGQDVFTVRGKGRFCLCRIGGKSRKDRIFVEYFQY